VSSYFIERTESNIGRIGTYTRKFLEIHDIGLQWETMTHIGRNFVGRKNTIGLTTGGLMIIYFLGISCIIIGVSIIFSRPIILDNSGYVFIVTSVIYSIYTSYKIVILRNFHLKSHMYSDRYWNNVKHAMDKEIKRGNTKFEISYKENQKKV